MLITPYLLAQQKVRTHFGCLKHVQYLYTVLSGFKSVLKLNFTIAYVQEGLKRLRHFCQRFIKCGRFHIHH